MDLLKNLLVDNSCSVDGTVSSSNPLNTLVESIFDTSTVVHDDVTSASGSRQEYGLSGGSAITYVNPQQQYALNGMENILDIDMGMNMGQNMVMDASSQMQGAWEAEGGGGLVAPLAPIMTQGMNPNFQMQQMMHMTQLQQYMQHQQMIHMQYLEMQERQQEQMAYEAEEQEASLRDDELNKHDTTCGSHQHIEAALQSALEEEGDLGVERLEDIWKQFQQQHPDSIQIDNEANKSELKNSWSNLQDSQKGFDDSNANMYNFAMQNQFLASHQMAAAATAEDLAKHAHDADELFEKGMKLFHSGDITRAILAFEAHLQINADHDESWRMLGSCHAENDMDKEAIICLKRAKECDPYNLDTLLALGTSHVNELDSAGALRVLKEWVLHHPTFCGLTPVQDEYSDGTLMDEVMQLILAAHAYAPKDPDVKVLLGVLYNVSQNFGEAVQLFHEALQLRPDDYTLMNKLGATLANSSESAKAIPLYEKALQTRPTYTRGWLNLGISHANLNQYDEAARAYVRALELNPQGKHMWGYLRVVFTCMNDLDAVELCSREDITGLLQRLNRGE